MDTADGVALRIGSSASAIKEDLDELVKLGILVKKQIGSHEVIFLDAKRDKEIQQAISDHIESLKPGQS
jgi:hypothetical protein